MNRETLSEITNKLQEQLEQLSSREKGIILIASIVIVAAIGLYSVESVAAVFSSQNRRLEQAENNLDKLPENIRSYITLETRAKALENEFKRYDVGEGLNSYIENLVRTKGGDSDYQLRSTPKWKPFREGFERSSPRIEFMTDDLSKLTALLEGLTSEPKPLIIDEVRLEKTSSNMLKVLVVANALRRNSNSVQ